jgi:hypothetical protein
MSNASRQIIKSLLEAIGRPPDIVEVLENEMFSSVGYRPITGYMIFNKICRFFPSDSFTAFSVTFAKPIMARSSVMV